MDSPLKSLKVTELKERLAARGLSTKGLKKDLVERLEGATAGDDIEGSDETETRHAAVDQEDVEMIDEEATAKEDAATIEDNDEIAKNAASAEGSGGPEDDHVKLDYGDANEPAGIPVAPLRDEGKDGATGKDDNNTFEQLDKGGWKVSHPSAASAAADSHSSSSIIKITNFVRPFTLDAVRELVNKYGTVTTFWMDRLRTIAFVEYDSAEAAELCKFHVHSIQWPPITGHQLEVSFSSADLMNAAMNAPVVVEPVRFEGKQSSALQITKTLDDLFCKTKSRPHLYYLPRHKQ